MTIAKLTSNSENMARRFATPVILLILRRFSAVQLNENIKDKVDLVNELKANPSALKQLTSIIHMIPFADTAVLGALDSIRSKRWLRWFINNELAHKRRDLYMVFLWNEDAFDWLLFNMGKLSHYLIEQLS